MRDGEKVVSTTQFRDTVLVFGDMGTVLSIKLDDHSSGLSVQRVLELSQF